MRKDKVELIKSKDGTKYLIIVHLSSTYASQTEVTVEDLRSLDELIHQPIDNLVYK